MDIELKVHENTRNIASLTSNVAELTAMFKYAEKSREESHADVKAVINELKSLNEKMATIPSLQKDLMSLTGDVRALSHDMKNVQVLHTSVSLMKDMTAKHEARIDALEKLRDKAEGATDTAKVFIHAIWAFVSAGGLGFIAWVFMKFNGVHISGE